MPHVKGPKAGARIKLELWQKFIICVVFGWIVKATGYRRFRRAYVEVPRGNAKSTLSSGIGLNMVAEDGEGGSEVYSAATTRDQAKIVFQDAQQMARMCEGYRRRFGVTVGAHCISQVSSNSRFEPLSADAHTLDGLSIHCAIVDELHAHKTRKVYDVLETATAKRLQSLLWAITTAGFDRSGICYEVRTYLTKVLQKIINDDSFFGIIFTIDDEDDWMEPAAWVKANPNWGISVMPDVIAQLAHKAIQMPSAQNNFKTKHLNIWCNQNTIWMDMRKWQDCEDPKLNLASFDGEPCIIGLDLASKLDLLAKVRVFWKQIEGKPHYYVFGDYWTPEERVMQSPNSQYQGWVNAGLLHTCPGETNDYDIVEVDIEADGKRFDVIELAVDPWQTTQLVNRLGNQVTCVDVPQTPRYLSEPMKEMEAAVYDGRFHHNGDPILTWAVSNVVCHVDKNDNLFPTKERFENKIDPVTALLSALNRVMANGEVDPDARKPFFV